MQRKTKTQSECDPISSTSRAAGVPVDIEEEIFKGKGVVKARENGELARMNKVWFPGDFVGGGLGWRRSELCWLLKHINN